MYQNTGFAQQAHAVISLRQQIPLAWLSQKSQTASLWDLWWQPVICTALLVSPCFFPTQQFTGLVLMLCSAQRGGLPHLSSQHCHLTAPSKGPLLMPCAQGSPWVPCAQGLVTVRLTQDLSSLWSAGPRVCVAVQWNRLGKESATNDLAKSHKKGGFNCIGSLSWLGAQVFVRVQHRVGGIGCVTAYTGTTAKKLLLWKSPLHKICSWGFVASAVWPAQRSYLSLLASSMHTHGPIHIPALLQ